MKINTHTYRENISIISNLDHAVDHISCSLLGVYLKDMQAKDLILNMFKC